MMFRALLWKEWRELWMWPIISVAYVVLVFLAHQLSNRPLPSDFWAETFLVWALALGTVVPTYLYTREKETSTVHFLLSKPLDKFRLWWLRLPIGLTVVIASALLVYGTVQIMALFYETTGTFNIDRTESIWRYACFALFVYGLSSFTSTLTRRKLIAVAAVSFMLIFAIMLWSVASRIFDPIGKLDEMFSDSSYLSGIRFLALAPLFLFASLVLFAKNSLWRQTRKTIVAGYAVSAMVLLIPSAAGMMYLSSTTKVALRDWKGKSAEKEKRWFVSQMSEGGSRIVAHLSGEDLLVVIDLLHRKARIIDTGIIDRILLRPQGDLFLYFNMGDRIYSPAKLVLTDLQGAKKEELFRGFVLFWQNAPTAEWSLDGALIGVAKGSRKELPDGAFVAIYDISGNVVAKHTFPPLEHASLYALGWDTEKRFYFAKEIEKGDQTVTTYWRISLDDFNPEAVSFIPEDECTSITISPNGKWFVRTKPWSKVYEDKENDKLRLTSIGSGKDLLVSANSGSHRWSKDGKILVFLEHRSKTPDQANSTSQLVLFHPETGERSVISVEKSSGSPLFPYWRESDTFWFFTDNREYQVFSLETRQIERVAMPGEKRLLLYWEKDGPPLWQVENKLIATDHDGSNPRETFRFEGKKFFFGGKEQS